LSSAPLPRLLFTNPPQPCDVCGHKRLGIKDPRTLDQQWDQPEYGVGRGAKSYRRRYDRKGNRSRRPYDSPDDLVRKGVLTRSAFAKIQGQVTAR
jgi:hypothetical protein